MALLLQGEASGALAEEVVGAVGAANAGPTARAPNKAQRGLKPGDDVFFKDRISTGRGGSAQITLLDRSTLNVGENSEVVIDEFVYQPGAAGTMRAKLNRGMLRYVGGEISHGGGATVETPVATIGIRGGIGVIGYVKDATAIARVPGVPHDFKGGTIVIANYGTMTVHGPSSEMVIRRPGFAIFVDASARTIPAPVRLDASSVQALMKTIGSRDGQHGGASAAARGKAVAVTSTLGTTINVPSVTASVPTTNGLDYTAVFSAGNAFARVRSQAQQAGQLTDALATASLTSRTTTVGATVTPMAVPTVPVATPTAATSPASTVPASTIPVLTGPAASSPPTPIAAVPAAPVATVAVAPVAATPSSITPSAAVPVVQSTTSSVTPIPAAPAVTTPVVAAPTASSPTAPVATTPASPVVTKPASTAPVATPSAQQATTKPAATAPSAPSVPAIILTIPLGPFGTIRFIINPPILGGTTNKDNGIGNNFSNNGHNH